MIHPSWREAAAPLALAVALASCAAATSETGPRTVQPGAPGEATRPVDPPQPGASPASAPTEADVRFIRDMLLHHAQALEMTALVPTRTTSDAIRLLSQRIEVSQNDEIAMMRRWLDRHAPEAAAADPHAAHHGAAGHGMMPGMLSPEELQRLAAARGAEFDRLFLEFMIRHHEGALVMVEELFASEGAGQTGEIYQIASEVASDQRIEIERMRRMLGG